MNQKTVRQLKSYARDNKIDFHQLKAKWDETPWNLRNAFRQEVTGKVTNVAKAKKSKAKKPTASPKKAS